MKKIASILCLVVLVIGCRNSDVPGRPFERGKLSAAELASMGQKNTPPSDGPPIYRAIWNEEPVRHVCLQSGVLGGFNAFYGVAVFSPDGTLDEQTDINIPEGYEPYRLLHLSVPMVIWFRDPTGKRKDFFKEANIPEDWQTRGRAAEDRLREEIRRLEATGSDTQFVVAFKARLKQIQDREKASEDDKPKSLDRTTGSDDVQTEFEAVSAPPVVGKFGR